jgi:hypothetical protein
MYSIIRSSFVLVASALLRYRLLVPSARPKNLLTATSTQNHDNAFRNAKALLMQASSPACGHAAPKPLSLV